MTAKTLFATAALAAVLATAPLAFAQAPAPITQTPTAPARPTAPTTPTAPAVTQPARPTPATPTAQTPVGQKVSLNTGTAADLDKLPQIGAARAKVILDERTAKGRYKNWDDFVGRLKGTSVNQTALDAIKDKVTF